MKTFKQYIESKQRENGRSVEDVISFFSNESGTVGEPYLKNSPWQQIAESIYESATTGDTIYERPLRFTMYSEWFSGWTLEEFKELYDGVVKNKIIPRIRGSLNLCKSAFIRQKDTLRPEMLSFVSKDLKKLDTMNSHYESSNYHLVPPKDLNIMLKLVDQMVKDGLRIF